MVVPQTATGAWPRQRVEEVARQICQVGEVREALAAAASADAPAVRDILQKARSLAGLTPLEAAALVQVTDPDLRQEIKQAARLLQERLRGRRVGLSVPLCPTNRCVNECLYCPLRRSNSRLRRSSTSPHEVQREVAGLLSEGHCHLNLVFGDDRSGVQYVRDTVWAVYGVRSNLRQIQRVDLNLNPMSVPELRELAGAGVATLHMFQETYDPEAYSALHRDGPKADYTWRLTGHDRACEAGLRNLGLGILLGAADFRFDVVALLAHADYLAATYGQEPHAITYPRMIPVPQMPGSRPAHAVSDEEFSLVVAVTRLSRPRTDLVLCTPATGETRRELYALGVTEVSVGSSSYPGTYTSDGDPEAAGTFVIGRPRALEYLVNRMLEQRFIPDFCVACYARRRRRGEPAVFPEPREETLCAPNALLALKDYLMDFASPDTRVLGERVIQAELARLPESARTMTLELMEEAEAGLRGLAL